MILGIHGVGYERLSPDIGVLRWRKALGAGLKAADADPQLAGHLRFLHYGTAFLPSGVRGPAESPYDADDVEPGFERELLQMWFEQAARTDPNLPKPGDRTRLPHIPRTVQTMLSALSNSRTFAKLSEAGLIFQLKQVHRYLSEPATRREIQARVSRAITPEIRVIIAHSLGTVVAYEALCACSQSKVEGLITMGSPLGTRNLIFDRLVPAPKQGLGEWPASLQWWVNVADPGDVVALEKHLSNCFGHRVEDWEVENGIVEVHAAEKYLAQTAVGAALRRIQHA